MNEVNAKTQAAFDCELINLGFYGQAILNMTMNGSITGLNMEQSELYQSFKARARAAMEAINSLC